MMIQDLESELSALLSNWQLVRARGEDATPEALCGERQDLLAPLKQRIEQVRRLEELAARRLSDEPDPTPTAREAALLKSLTRLIDPPESPEELGRIAGFQLVKLIGHGGMGLVFQAREQQPRRQVALKLMRPEMTGNQEARQRFVREGQSTATIEHERIVPIYRVGEHRGLPFLVMPLLRGETLEARLAREPRLSLAEVVRVGREIAEGLAAAHRSGVVHRDIKPANVWLRDAAFDGEGQPHVVLLDFGLARPEQADESEKTLTGKGIVMGTAHYMSPEQADCQRADRRTDLYSLGCILYEMVSHKRLFEGEHGLDLFGAIAYKSPAPLRAVTPSPPGELCRLVHQLLEKKRDQRVQTASECISRLWSIEVDLASQATASKPRGGLLQVASRFFQRGSPR